MTTILRCPKCAVFNPTADIHLRDVRFKMVRAPDGTLSDQPVSEKRTIEQANDEDWICPNCEDGILYLAEAAP